MDLKHFNISITTECENVYEKYTTGLGEPFTIDKKRKLDFTYTGAIRLYADKNRIAKKLVSLADEGDFMAIKYIYDRLEPITKDINVNANLGSNSVVDAINQFKALIDKDKDE